MSYKLEDMFSDCTVIRTTLETFELFPSKDPIREEMWEIIGDARANLRRGCAELRADIAHLTVLDQPLDVQEFDEGLRTLLLVGYPRRRLDACMKLNVFQSVAKAEAGENEPDPLYRYELLPPMTTLATFAMSAKRLTATIFDDLLRSIETDAHYTDKHAFDRHVFQKYIAIMFACYATTDPLFYA
jgi:hypothetical protein